MFKCLIFLKCTFSHAHTSTNHNMVQDFISLKIEVHKFYRDVTTLKMKELTSAYVQLILSITSFILMTLIA